METMQFKFTDVLNLTKESNEKFLHEAFGITEERHKEILDLMAAKIPDSIMQAVKDAGINGDDIPADVFPQVAQFLSLKRIEEMSEQLKTPNELAYVAWQLSGHYAADLMVRGYIYSNEDQED